MKAPSQYELHPDAELLSAFAEQALGGSERDDVLHHLAACGRCRQVVALARNAAEPDVVAKAAVPEARRQPIQANAWWKQWRAVWIPTAVVAAFAVTSIAFYLRQVELREAASRMAELSPKQQAEPAMAPPPAEQLKAVPPAALAPATPASKIAKENPPEPTKGAGDRLKSVPMIADRFSPVQRPLPAPPPPAPSLPEQPSSVPALAGSGFLNGNRPDFNEASASAQLQAERKEQDERQQSAARVLHGAMFAAKASPPPTEHGEQRNATEQVAVSAAQTEIRLAPIPHFETLQSAGANALATHAMRPIRLPSSRPAISVATAGKVSLAIDQAGALFISQDEGSTWERVLQQWTGRAVVVRRQTSSPTAAPQLPDAKEQPEPADAASAVSHPDRTFEIVNDQGQVWWSADGRIWFTK
jgi:protein TonB